jgi:hypothetical protein
MTGQEVIKFIQDNHLEDAVITVTATKYYYGDHDCITTDEVTVDQSYHLGHKTINFYVDDVLNY